LASQFGKSEMFVPFFEEDKEVATIMHWINWRFLGGVESVEVDDFIQEFSLWCDTQ
jgi:hypothetical protein